MNKKVKILSIVLASVLGVGAIAGSLLLFRKRPSGTQAAQILLARENMDANETKISWNNILNNQTISASENNNALLSNNYINLSTPKGELVHDSKAGKVYKDGSIYSFTNLSGASHDGVVVEGRIFGIEYKANYASELINYIKNDLNIVNKWVNLGVGTFLLTVQNGSETLIEKSITEEGSTSISVLERKTLENTKSVYNMFQTEIVDGTLTLPSFTSYTPNEKYEYYFEHGGDIKDFVIAENKDDYWNIMMLEATYFSNIIVKDNFAYQKSTSFDNLDKEVTGGRIISSSLKNDIINVYDGGITLYLDAFNNIESITTSEENVWSSQYYTDDGKEDFYNVSFTKDADINLTNGKVLSGEQTYTYSNGSVTLQSLYIDFFSNPGFADPQYCAGLQLKTQEGITLDKQFALLNEFLTDTGMTCKYNLDIIKNSIKTNQDYHAVLPDHYTWMGYKMNSSENVELGTKVLHNNFNEFYEKYNAVKDNETVSAISIAKLNSKTDFNNISSYSLDSATYSNGKITISNASASTNASNLLEKNKDYKLVIGLSRTDTSGNPISKNTIPLKTTAEVDSETFTGQKLSLSASGEYAIPTILEEGNYVIVCYIATADSEIRVSKMQPIAFIDTVNETIENDFVKFEIKTLENKVLLISVTPKLELQAQIAQKESYTYNEVKRALMVVVLSCGYSKQGEQILDNEGNVVDSSASLTSGRYKLKFTISTLEGACDAYVYIELN